MVNSDGDLPDRPWFPNPIYKSSQKRLYYKSNLKIENPVQVISLDWAIRKIGTAAISGYQAYISPRKGFTCAHRKLYGGVSCSEYVKQAIANQELTAIIQISRQRFQGCKQANQIIRNHYNTTVERNDPNSQKQKSRNCKGDRCDLGCEAIECIACSDCGILDCSSIDCGSCWG